VSDYEDLRDALRRGAGSPGDTHDSYAVGEPIDTEGMLRRVRRGARQRRARRTVGGVVAVAALVAAVTVAVPAVLDDGSAPIAGEDSTAGMQPAAQTVSAAGDAVWVTARIDCASGTCPALARSTDSGASWTLAEVQVDGAASAFAVQEVEVAGTGTDGWAWNQTRLVASHDAGDTWAEVEVPGGPLVTAVAAGTARAVALTAGGVASGHVLSVADVASDRWVPATTPLRGDEMVMRVFAGGDVLGAVVGSSRTMRADSLLTAPSGTGWERSPLPCRPGGQVLADTDGVTLWTACINGGSTVVADSTAGAAWDTVALPAIVGRTSMTARDDGSLLLAGPDRSYVIDADGAVDRIDPPAGDPDARQAVDDGYGSAASGTADWLVTTGGKLLGSDDGGTSWESARLR